MTENTLLDWSDRIAPIDYAFQPIVNIHTGACYGYEALIRNVEDAGFKSINAFFDRAFESNMLYSIDLLLRQKAQKKFTQIEGFQNTKLFYNLDNRMFEGEACNFDEAFTIDDRIDLPISNLCFEVSERHELSNLQDKAGILNDCRKQGYKIAVDDCGIGFSGMQLLYYLKPDYIKIDRFFIKDIERDPDKRLLVMSIVNISHIMGSMVIAEGVETIAEYYSCKNIGCDLLQGYLVQRPELDVNKLRPRYSCVDLLRKIDKRDKNAGDKSLIVSEIEHIEPVSCQDRLIDVRDSSRFDKKAPILPVVNEYNEPLGIVREEAVKDFAYSESDRPLLENTGSGKTINDCLAQFPVADIHSSVEQILEIYAMHKNIEGIVIVNNMKYVGFLSAHSLLKLLNEKNLALARDLNPLTKLPGSTMIYAYVSNAIQETNAAYHLVYFDFDFFKAYNDKYGFRRGDRILLLFAERLKSTFHSQNAFTGHVGGDDFFVGVKGASSRDINRQVQDLTKSFENDVQAFYDKETLSHGYVMGKDRDGILKKMPLLTVSSVILEMPAGMQRISSPDEMGNCIADLKKEAKKSPERSRHVTLQDVCPPPVLHMEKARHVRLVS